MIPPCGAVRLLHILLFFQLRTERSRRQTPKREMLQRAVMCADSEMWTVEVVTCQVTQPDEELYNALAWDNTRPCCVRNGSASAAAILSHRGSGTVVMWAETVTMGRGQCGSGGGQSVCSCHCVTTWSDHTQCKLECEFLSTSAVQVTGPSWPQQNGCGTRPQSKGSSSASRGGGSRSGVGEYCCEIVKRSKANLHPMAVRSTSTPDRPASKVGVMSTSANKRRKLLSVLCSSHQTRCNRGRAT